MNPTVYLWNISDLCGENKKYQYRYSRNSIARLNMQI